ncbi:Indole-3-glycerol phosphate synthase, chloroplastic [Linum grandiflorum]
MEGLASLNLKSTPGVSSPSSTAAASIGRRLSFSVGRSLVNLPKGRSFSSVTSIRAQRLEAMDVVTKASSSKEELESVLKAKEWEIGMLQVELAASQGIRIRRRPPTSPPLHYVGPFELTVQNEGDDTTPRNILEEIVWYKDTEVSQMKAMMPFSTLKKAVENARPTRDFVGALKEANLRTGFPGLIAEVKKASPSRGVLRENFDPVEVAQSYEKGGAACLSVLTDVKFFQIYYARLKGADAVLLIAAVLSDLDIKYMIKICKMLGLAALVEVHDEREMDRVLRIDGIELVGINNRSLETFEVDISNTKKLLEGDRGKLIRDKGIIVVGESGLFTPEHIAYVQEAGVGAVLVGESLVKQGDPGQGISGLFGRDMSA